MDLSRICTAPPTSCSCIRIPARCCLLRCHTAPVLLPLLRPHAPLRWLPQSPGLLCY
jgi:hypothetical protein